MGGGSMDSLQGSESWTVILEITGPISDADAKALSAEFHKCLKDCAGKYHIKYHIGVNAKGSTKIWSKG